MPESLSDDLNSGQIEIDGIVYQLPIPLKVLFDNGFDIGFEDDNFDTDTDTDIAPGKYFVDRYVEKDKKTRKFTKQYLMKDGKKPQLLKYKM